MASYTAQPPALRRVQYDPAADGSVSVQAFFQTVLINDADPSDKIAQNWQEARFALPPTYAQSIESLARAALDAA